MKTRLACFVLLSSICACDPGRDPVPCTLEVFAPTEVRGVAGSAFEQAFASGGAAGEVAFTLDSGVLPAGLGLAEDGVLSGTPTEVGGFPLVVRATDSAGCSATSETYPLELACPAITVEDVDPPAGDLGESYGHAFGQTGAVGAVTWTLAQGSLPDGLALEAGGAVTGSPTALGEEHFTVQATDANGCSASLVTRITVHDVFNFPPPGSWTPANYYTGVSVGSDGWINGLNVYLDEEKAALFDTSASAGTEIAGARITFGRAFSADPAKILTVRVLDGSGGAPGAQLTAATLTMGAVMSDVEAERSTSIAFTPGATLPASRRFFVSVVLTGLAFSSAPDRDVLSITSNSAGQTLPSAIWERQSTHTWYQYGTAGSWNLNASLYVFPVLAVP